MLHDEPAGLLLDDLRDTTQVASVLSLVGQGCHRLSEIAARLGKPATSLSRPLQRLIGLGLVRREVPFGTSVRDTKRTLYQIADPFVRFWFRFVEPNRSSLEARRIDAVAAEVGRALPAHVGGVWEELSRASVPGLRCGGLAWKPAGRWWGTGLDRRAMEVDLVAESADGSALLVGEAKWAGVADLDRLVEQLRRKAENLPGRGDRKIVLGLWLRAPTRRPVGASVFTPGELLRALR